MTPPTDCAHEIVTRWKLEETGEFVNLWACQYCRRRFEPLATNTTEPQPLLVRKMYEAMKP